MSLRAAMRSIKQFSVLGSQFSVKMRLLQTASSLLEARIFLYRLACVSWVSRMGSPRHFNISLSAGGCVGLSVFHAGGEVGERELAACGAASAGMRVERALHGI